MYIVQPITVEKIWGDSRLHQYQGDIKSHSIGIVYSVSGIKDYNCLIHNQDTTTTLMEAVSLDPEQFGLHKGDSFPIIVAFDACRESVSFQIHPTDTYAKEKLHLPYGKSEAWYFIEAPEDGWVYAETPKESGESVAIAAQTGDFNGIVKHKKVKVNDLVYIRSGTIHALTKGSLIYEIQQSTNITYRLYDYDRRDAHGRKRSLHIRESLETLDPSLKINKQEFGMNAAMNQREFRLTHKNIEHTYTNPTDIVQAVSLLKGSVFLNQESVSQGQSLLVLPHETISFAGRAETIIATPHLYFH